MRTAHAGFLSDITHCPMLTSKSVVGQCLMVNRGFYSNGSSDCSGVILCRVYYIAPLTNTHTHTHTHTHYTGAHVRTWHIQNLHGDKSTHYQLSSSWPMTFNKQLPWTGERVSIPVVCTILPLGKKKVYRKSVKQVRTTLLNPVNRDETWQRLYGRWTSCERSLWQHAVQQSVGLSLLLLQLWGSLGYQLLQTGGVTLHHLQHVVHDVARPEKTAHWLRKAGVKKADFSAVGKACRCCILT